MAMDIMGNSFGGYDLENDSDEELLRRRREFQKQQQQKATPVKQTVTIDPTTGQQTMKIEGSVQDLSAANPLTPTVVAPVPPRSLNDADITRQRESGGNYGIGYHNPQKSTAYGAYGLTAPAYKDVQAANPAFANKPITALSPQEQDQAYNTFRDVQGRQLQQFGLQPTSENLRLAHLLGAKGAADYVNGNQVSPQAAAANGGEAQLRAEAQRRMGGPGVQMASSGSVMSDVAPTPNEMAIGQLRQQGQLPPAAPVAPVAPQAPQQGPAVAAPINPNQPPQAPQPSMAQMAPGAPAPEQAGPPTSAMSQEGWAQRLNTAKQDDRMLSNLAYDPNTPQFVREEAANTLYQKLDASKREKEALQAYKDGLANGNIDSVLRKSKSNTEEGSWLKYILYGFIDPNMAKNERLKLFPDEGAKWVDFTSEDGKQHGLIQMGQNGMPLKGKFDDGTMLNDKQLMEYSQGVSTLGKGIHTGMTLYNMSDNQTATLGNNGKFYRNGRALSPSVKAVSEFKEGVNQRKQAFNESVKQLGKWYEVDPSKITPAALQDLVSRLTPTGGNQVETIQMLQDNARSNGANPQIVERIGSVGSTLSPSSTGYTSTPSNTIAGAKSNIAIGESTSKKLGESNIDYSNNLAKDRQSATSQRSTIDRLQKSIDTNPEFWGVVSSSPAFMAFRDAQSDEKKGAALNALAQNLNIPANKRPAFDAAMNDYRALEVNAITSSGLSASQTNTEKESQRVVGQVGSIGDKPQAAKAALEYAKAKIEYTDAKARAWIQARRSNPGIDRLDFESNFDATQGEQIFKDANDRMAKIVSSASGVGGPAVGTVKDGWKFKGGNPADKNNWEKT